MACGTPSRCARYVGDSTQIYDDGTISNSGARLGMPDPEVQDRVTQGKKAGTTQKLDENEPDTRQAIYWAMVHSIYLNGYNGAPLREVASSVGIRMPSLYHHFSSKQDLLLEIMRRTMNDLTESVSEAIEGCDPSDPEKRLRAAITAHVVFHAERREEAFVTDSELRALDPRSRRAMASLRDKYEELFGRVIRDGREKGVFIDLDERLTINALLGMCSQVAIWYRSGGRLTIQEVASGYSNLFLMGVMSKES
jgi:AcrR family transcriptional regulator